MKRRVFVRGLSHLAENENFSVSTQNRVLNADVFMYGHVLAQSLGKIGGVARANKIRQPAGPVDPG